MSKRKVSEVVVDNLGIRLGEFGQPMTPDEARDLIRELATAAADFEAEEVARG